MKARRSTIVLSAAAILAGCMWSRPELRPDAKKKGSLSQGQSIAPKRCLLKVAIVSRPFADASINDVLWCAADEQVLSPESRRNLDANGLRAGLIPGSLPMEIQEMLDVKPPKRRIEPVTIILLDGESNLVSIG